MNPVLQAHVNEPTVSVQTALLSQGSAVSHSLISEVKVTSNNINVNHFD